MEFIALTVDIFCRADTENKIDLTINLSDISQNHLRFLFVSIED